MHMIRNSVGQATN